MGDVITCEPAGGPAGAGAAGAAAGGAAGRLAEAGGAAGARAGAGTRDGSAGAAAYSTCGALDWPSTLRRKPERSTSNPWRPRVATSSMSSLICSNVSKTKPLFARPGAGPRSRGSGEISLQEQARPPELEPGLAVVALGSQHE